MGFAAHWHHQHVMAADPRVIPALTSGGRTDLRVHLDEGVPTAQANVVLWLPEAACDQLVDDLCRHANLYCTHAHLSAVAPETSAGRAITVDGVADIGGQTWAGTARVVGS